MLSRIESVIDAQVAEAGLLVPQQRFFRVRFIVGELIADNLVLIVQPDEQIDLGIGKPSAPGLPGFLTGFFDFPQHAGVAAVSAR